MWVTVALASCLYLAHARSRSHNSVSHDTVNIPNTLQSYKYDCRNTFSCRICHLQCQQSTPTMMMSTLGPVPPGDLYPLLCNQHQICQPLRLVLCFDPKHDRYRTLLTLAEMRPPGEWWTTLLGLITTSSLILDFTCASFIDIVKVIHHG
jgi:hypothetical protein